MCTQYLHYIHPPTPSPHILPLPLIPENVILYTMEFYSATKKNEMLSFVGKWIELENIILSKANQVQKAKSYVFSLICGIQI
jgi:hypothetical protein